MSVPNTSLNCAIAQRAIINAALPPKGGGSLARDDGLAFLYAVLSVLVVLILVLGVAIILSPGVKPPPPKPQQIHMRQCPIEEDACWVPRVRFE